MIPGFFFLSPGTAKGIFCGGQEEAKIKIDKYFENTNLRIFPFTQILREINLMLQTR